MSEKSYVTLEQRVCHVCGKTYDTGSILMDTRIRNRFEHHTVTGMGLCPEDEKLHKDGYVALVEIKDPPHHGSMVKAEDAYRTGKMAHIKREAAREIFNVPDAFKDDLPMVFVQPGVIDKLTAMLQEGGDEGETEAAESGRDQAEDGPVL